MAEPSDPAKPSGKTSDKSSEKTEDKKAPAKAQDKKASDKADKAAPDKADKAASDKKTEEAAKTSADKKSDDKADKAASDNTDKAKAQTSAQPTRSSSVPGSGPARPSAAAAKPASSSGGRAFVVVLVLVVLIGAGGYFTRDVWMPYAEPLIAKFGGGDAAPDAEAAANPVDRLSERVAALEAKVGGGDGDMAAMQQERERVRAELDQALTRIDDLERRLAEVREIANAVTSSGGAEVDLSPVMSRMDGLEESGRETRAEIEALNEKMQSMSANANTGQGLVLAVAQLRDAALSGRPFAAQLDSLRAVAGGDAELTAAASRLSDHAEDGLPSADALKQRFSEIAGEIVTQARVGDGDWLEQAAGRLSSLVSLRRTDGQSGDPVEDAVAAIETDLAAGDVVAAVDKAQQLSDALPPQAQDVLEPWLLDAKARAGAVRALNALHAKALAGLDGG